MSLYFPRATKIVDDIWRGCAMATTARSKQDNTRIIKLQIFFRSFNDLHRLMITTEFRNIPETMKATLKTHSKHVLIIVLGSFLKVRLHN